MPDLHLAPMCPYCGSRRVGQRDYIPGLAMIAYIGKSEDAVEWTGSTEMFWDDQVPQKDPITYGCLACDTTFSFEQLLDASRKLAEQEERDHAEGEKCDEDC